MRFDVVKATEYFSQWERTDSHCLVFEIVPNGQSQLDIGDDYVLIGKGYHAFTAKDRQQIGASLTVRPGDVSKLGTKDEPACGHAQFWPERESRFDLDYEPAALLIDVTVEPQLFEALVRTRIDEPGAASVGVSIEELEYGYEPDGSHQIWKLDGKERSKKPVSNFSFNLDKFWTSQQAIFEAEDKQTKAWLADSPDPEERKLAAPPEEPDRIASLLSQCRWLLLAGLVLGALALASCGKAAADDCLDLPVYPPAGITDLKQEVFACVERNAALYAKGTDTPEAISKAVMVKCQPTIMRYVEQEAKAAGEQPQYSAALEGWREHALPVIAEARARGCYS